MKKRILPILFVVFMAITFFSNSVPAKNKNAITYNKDGWEHLKRGDNDKAVYSFINALHKNPKYIESMLGLGNAYYKIEAYAKAYEMYHDVLKIDADSKEALIGSGTALTALGRYNEAMHMFNLVLKKSKENITARYGIANLYYKMGKKIWAERKILTILNINPFYYEALLLKAELKASSRRFNEAKQIIKQAININNEKPDAYILLGKVLFIHYLQNEDSDTLNEAQYALANAVSIQPKNIQANKMLGNINLFLGNYTESIQYFQKIAPDIENSSIYYSLAVAYSKANQLDQAMDNYLQAYKLKPLNTIIRSGFENFLYVNDYKIGHPARMLLNDINYNIAIKRQKMNLPDETIMYLRRALMLNPLNKNAREKLMEYYKILGYHRFYVEELKEMQRFFSVKKYRDKLNIEIIKRRNLLYHREGYSFNKPPRDVPDVLVLNFETGVVENNYPDTGAIITMHLNFALKQYGRLIPVQMKTQQKIVKNLRSNGDYLEKSITALKQMVKSKSIQPIDYIVYGTYWGNWNNLTVKCYILNFNKGYIIDSITVSSTGKETVPKLAIRCAKKIYNTIPYSGRVLAVKDDGIVVNLGNIDGITIGSKLVIKKRQNRVDSKQLTKKILLEVKETDTYLSYAVLSNKSDLKNIDTNDVVFSHKRHRARKIE